jgi:hypothetical protein
MYSVVYLGLGGATLEVINLGMLASAIDADLEARRLLDGVRLRHAAVAGYRVLNNAGQEVAKLWPSHA